MDGLIQSKKLTKVLPRIGHTVMKSAFTRFCTGDRVIVPTTLRKNVMSRLEASHQGEQACLRQARDALFWPGISQQIRDLVSSAMQSLCILCNSTD